VSVDQPTCTLTAEDADVLATYPNWTGESDAAATRSSYGDGNAVYVGPIVSRDFASALVPELLEISGLPDRTAGFECPDGVELYREYGIVALFNHTGSDQTVDVDEPRTDALSGDEVSGSVTVPAHGFRLVESDTV
jgi:beta-galactosidase GanA